MLTGEIRNKVDAIWKEIWSGGMSNPLEVIEQLTYLLFIRRLDEAHTLAENRANATRKPIQNPIFTPEQQHLRWKNLKGMDAETLFATMQDKVFPFIKTLGQSDENDGIFTELMKDARFSFPSSKPGLFYRVVQLLDSIPMQDRDTKGDLYEYLLSKLATSGQNGQFRTPRHIIRLLVELTQPGPRDRIIDPASGTAGFLVAALEYVEEHHPEIYTDPDLKAHLQSGLLHGIDFDPTMLRVAAMNLMLHGIEQPQLEYADALSNTLDPDLIEDFTLVLANPPFTGSLDETTINAGLYAGLKTKKTELLFLGLTLLLLKTGGRAAVIVPDGVLFGSTKAHKALRKNLVEQQHLQGVISMPSGVFKPYAGVSTAILLFTKTNIGSTEDVWYYDMQADGYSLDDKRNPLPEGHNHNNIPDIIARWRGRYSEEERARGRTEQSFWVPKAEIAAQGYDLSIGRYKQVQHTATKYAPPAEILSELEELEQDIQTGLQELRELLA